MVAALAAFVPPETDPRRDVANLLGLCFNVPLQEQLLAEDIAEAKQIPRRSKYRACAGVHDRPDVSPARRAAIDRRSGADHRAGDARDDDGGDLAASNVGGDGSNERRPVDARRGDGADGETGGADGADPDGSQASHQPGPWLAAGIAAIVATSGIGLLRTHGRAARSRASAASTVVAPQPVAPTPQASPAANPEWPVAPALAESPPPAMAAKPATVAARAPIHALDRTPRNAPADRLLRQANNLWERGNTPGAYTLARQAVAAGAGAPAHVLLGALLINMKNYAAAEPELATAARLDPHNAEARRMLALLDRTAAEHQAK